MIIERVKSNHVEPFRNSESIQVDCRYRVRERMKRFVREQRRRPRAKIGNEAESEGGIFERGGF